MFESTLVYRKVALVMAIGGVATTTSFLVYMARKLAKKTTKDELQGRNNSAMVYYSDRPCFHSGA